HIRAAMKPSSFSRFIERLPPKRSRIALRRSSSASVNGSGFTAHLPPRSLPRIGPPPVAECDPMACGELCCWRQNTASGQEPSNKLITERPLSWPFPSICRPLLRARRERPFHRRAADERDEVASPHAGHRGSSRLGIAGPPHAQPAEERPKSPWARPEMF